MKIPAILPIKKTDRAKTRLAKELTQKERKSLVHGMFSHVWRTCLKAGLKPLAVTSDPVLLERYGGLSDDGKGLNAAITKALTTFGLGEFFIILPDLPLLEPQTLREIVNLNVSYVVCPDGRLKGTNIVYVEGFRKYSPQFGVDSFRKHLKQKRDAKIFYEIGTALDIDRPEDLSLLRSLSTRPSGEN
ncbi:MAG: 2-phospho-L-lactate guanylyltransferase [Candidatus Caldarchaeum sp.]|nr:2-phospho-L-lactate guanylyltransferase [Candidatus Caldarchaeum sp.]